MTKTSLALFALLFSAQSVLAQSAPAAAAPQYPRISIGMVSFIQYDAELKNKDGYNAFDLTRAYINLNAQLSERVRFRFTPDIKRLSDGSLSGSLVARVKYGYVQFDGPAGPRSWVRVGLQQTPWLDFEEGVNRYRVQGTMEAERDGVIPGSADFGAGFFAPLPGGYGEVQAGVYNGEGYAHAELNKFKSVQGRLTFRPLPGRGAWNGLRVSGFYSLGRYDAGRPRNTGIVMGSYEHPHVVATLERVFATERPAATDTADISRRGTSGFVEVRQGMEGWAALARVDTYDPNTSLTDVSLRRVVAGGAYWFRWSGVRLGVVATDEQVHYDASAGKADENRLLVQTHVQF